MDIEKAKKELLSNVTLAGGYEPPLSKAIETVLNELERYENDVDILLNKIDEYEKNTTWNYTVKEKLDKKDKIINEMAIDLEYINAEILDEYDKLPYAENKQKIIDYFAKKVEGK